MSRRFEKTFVQRRYTNGQQVYERILNSLIIWEVHTKTTIRNHFMPTRMTIFSKKKSKITRIRKDVEKLESLNIACGNVE